MDPIPRAFLLAAQPPSTLARLAGPRTIALLPCGALEQHGPHLPVGTDSFLAEAWLAATLPLLPPRVRCFVAPGLGIGRSGEHRGFPGTVSLSTATFHGLALDRAEELLALGFRRLAFFNTHGGNSPVLDLLARDLSARRGVRCLHLRPPPPASLEPAAVAADVHAGRIETSLLLALVPHLVDLPAIPHGPPPPPPAPGVAWLASDFSTGGVLGDPAAAREDDGRRWLEQGAAALADTLAAFHRAP